VNSETDFVARNASFQSMVGEIAVAGLGAATVDDLSNAALPSGKSVAETITDNIATIGENMTLRRMGTLEGETVASYIHNPAAPNMGKIGVLVAATGSGDAVQEIARDIAMHVAALNPAGLDETSLDPALVEREKQVQIEKARESGKPDNVIEKMIEGRMRKFYEEVCLVKQSFVKNPDLTVEKAAAEAGATVTGYVRFQVGEGVEKDEGDFAAEVASMAGQG
jgi:elongation factor Ts